jgi:hypothetical protein
MRLRRWSTAMYAIALLAYALGAIFAFALPWWGDEVSALQ